MTLRELINALITLAALIVVIPVVIVAAAAVMVWDMCFGKPEHEDTAWEWADYE